MYNKILLTFIFLGFIAPASAKITFSESDQDLATQVMQDLLLQYKVKEGQAEFLESSLVGKENSFLQFVFQNSHQGSVNLTNGKKVKYISESGQIFWQGESPKEAGKLDLHLYLTENFDVGGEANLKNPLFVRFVIGFFFSCVGHAAHCDAVCLNACPCGLQSCNSQCGVFSGWQCTFTCMSCSDPNNTLGSIANPFYFPSSGIWGNWVNMTDVDDWQLIGDPE